MARDPHKGPDQPFELAAATPGDPQAFVKLYRRSRRVRRGFRECDTETPLSKPGLSAAIAIRDNGALRTLGFHDDGLDREPCLLRPMNAKARGLRCDSRSPHGGVQQFAAAPLLLAMGWRWTDSRYLQRR